MLVGSEQLDAPSNGCGATGNPPHSQAGRAISSAEIGHWGFDPDAYRRDHQAMLYSPTAISSALLILTAFCAVVMVAIALGAK